MDYNNYRLPVRVEKGIKLTSSRIVKLSEKDFIKQELTTPIMHMLSQPGKMLRPTLLLIGAHVIGEDPLEFVDMAVAFELLHVSSLIHDDIIDKDKMRRSAQAVHVKYGEEAAILAGDALISKAIQFSARYGEKAISMVAQATMDMCAGEILDSGYQLQDKIPNLDAYLEIAELKSASLIARACSIVADYKEMKIASNLYEFGKDIGIAFQIRDDVVEHVRAHIGFEDVRSRRINIVDTLAIEGDENALERAIGINNTYVDRALKRLIWKGRLAPLKEYARSVKVNLDYIKNRETLTQLASLQ